MSDFYSGFLRDLGGLAVLVTVLGFLFKYLLDHQFSKVQTQMSRFSDILSRRNEREFAVIERAIELMMVAVGVAQQRIGQGGPVPSFQVMQETDALAKIEASAFPEEQKANLRSADIVDRDRLYCVYEQAWSFRICNDACVDFENYLSIKQIFFQPAIFGALRTVEKELNHVLTLVKTHVSTQQLPVFGIQTEIQLFLDVSLNRRIDELGSIIRQRFWGEEK